MVKLFVPLTCPSACSSSASLASNLCRLLLNLRLGLPQSRGRVSGHALEAIDEVRLGAELGGQRLPLGM